MAALRKTLISLAELRSAALPAINGSVTETWDPEDPSHWRITGANTGVSVEIEDIGFWLISIDPGFLALEVENDDPELPVFLSAFDAEPLFLITSRVGRSSCGWWISFANGHDFGRKTRADKLIERSSKYSETRYEITRDALLPQVE